MTNWWNDVIVERHVRCNQGMTDWLGNILYPVLALLQNLGPQYGSMSNQVLSFHHVMNCESVVQSVIKVSSYLLIGQYIILQLTLQSKYYSVVAIILTCLHSCKPELPYFHSMLYMKAVVINSCKGSFKLPFNLYRP